MFHNSITIYASMLLLFAKELSNNFDDFTLEGEGEYEIYDNLYNLHLNTAAIFIFSLSDYNCYFMQIHELQYKGTTNLFFTFYVIFLLHTLSELPSDRSFLNKYEPFNCSNVQCAMIFDHFSSCRKEIICSLHT